MLKLDDKDFKGAIIKKMLQQVTNILGTNEKERGRRERWRLGGGRERKKSKVK